MFRAWADPKHLGQWWGPSGFTTTTHEFTLKPGGVWRHTMHGPDGTVYPNRLRFDRVVPNERLEYTHDDDVPATIRRSTGRSHSRTFPGARSSPC